MVFLNTFYFFYFVLYFITLILTYHVTSLFGLRLQLCSASTCGLRSPATLQRIIMWGKTATLQHIIFTLQRIIMRVTTAILQRIIMWVWGSYFIKMSQTFFPHADRARLNSVVYDCVCHSRKTLYSI